MGDGYGGRPGWGYDEGRSDLALESAVPADEVAEERVDVGGAPVVVTRRREVDGGRSVTLDCGRITARGESERLGLSELLAAELTGLSEALLGRPMGPGDGVLVAGLGNIHMTPDAIGPRTVGRLTVTRHLRSWDEGLFAALGCCELSALAPGVLGQTGMESGELIRAAVELVHPRLLLAVDALAARSCARLTSTIQLSDQGIAPGAGIGNHRMAITQETMGCPVISLGVPTVVDSSTLVLDALERAGMAVDTLPTELAEVLEGGRSFIVTPRDCDEMTDLTCRLLARGINLAFGASE